MFGKMLARYRDAAVIFGVMFVLSLATVGWAIYHDTLQPNPGLIAHDERTYVTADPTAENGQRTVVAPGVTGLPVDQSLGNLEGKELRFGTSAGATGRRRPPILPTARSTVCTIASTRSRDWFH